MLETPTDATRSSLELLYHVGRELASATNLRMLLQKVLSMSIKNVDGERGSIVVLDDNRLPVEATIIVGSRMIDHSIQQLRETVDRGLAGWVLRNGTPVLVADTSRDSRWLRRPDDALDQSGPKSAICVPLQAREQLVGVMTIVHPQPGFFSQDHVTLIQAIADMAGVAILNAHLLEQSQLQARVMTALAESAFALNSTLRLDQVLQRILDQTAQAMQAENILLGLIDEVKNELVFQAAAGKAAKTLMGTRMPLGKGIAGRVAQSGKGLVVPSARNVAQAQLPGVDIQSVVCAPVSNQGHTLGVLQAINPIQNNLSSEGLMVLTGIGSLAGIAIKNARLYEQLDSAHQRYREIFDGSVDPIIITDWKGKITEVSRQAISITGFDASAFTNANIATFHKVNQAKLGNNFDNIAKTGSMNYESNLSTSKGKPIPVDVYVQHITIDNKNFLQWIFRDITERKNLSSLQDDLISMVYHDLRSPLANVVSSLDLLQTMLPSVRDPEIDSVIAIATNSTDRMQRLVNSLLDIRRLESGQAITTKEKISPYDLAHEAVEASSFITTGKHQEITYCLAEGLPMLFVDPDMIRRVLINLIENACKFTPSDGKIEIGADRVGPWVQMWVRDSGPGIPLSEQERIFDKYTRLQTPGSPMGMGLGLAYCRLAVSAHKGQIWVVSQPRAGSQFIFTLPATE